MAEVGISVASKAAEYAVDPVVTRLGYIWNYKSNFENLEKQLQMLQGTFVTVKHSVEEATRNGEDIEDRVVNWLDGVEKMIGEVLKIIEDNNGANMRCFKSLCPDLKKRYQHSKIAVVKATEVSQLEKEGKFEKVSYHTPPKETWHPGGYEYFKSRQSTLEGILNALYDHDVNMVGVYGLGGSGKTTLVREVAKKAEEDELFDEVVFAEVSDTVDIRKIQAVIAERLGLRFTEDTEPVRADRLRKRIMQEGKILIILDNIWKDLDLAAVGIPFGNNHVGCKLLFTSRRMDLLSEMGSESNFPVNILEEEEACNLFMKISGVGDDLQSLAFEVAKECEGLLVAIITIANALKNKQECEWRIALRELRNPPSFATVEESVVQKAYSSIYLSYRHLESEQLKSIFLLCCIMGSTVDASIEELLTYAMGLSLFEEETTIEDVRDRVKKLIRKLKDSSLLLGTSNCETFSIHDVVRDVGRWIAEKDHHKHTVINNVIPRRWAGENILRNCTSITLHDIVELPKSLECPRLKFFYMKTKIRFSKLSNNFFEGMPNLAVLHLIEIDLSPLPASLRLLKNIRMLNLDRCRMEDIVDIVHMKNLEILLVSFDDGIGIKQLPEEIGQLKQLRLLDLRRNLFVIPPNTISRLTQLEELYMGKWYDQRQAEELNIVSLEELRDLVHLTTLDIHVNDAKTLPKGLVFKKLKRYNIIIGDCDKWGWLHEKSTETSKKFKVKSDTNICSKDGIIKQLRGIECLYLDGSQTVNNAESFPQLKHLHIGNNSYIQYIVDSMPSATYDAFPLLETMSLSNLVRLEKIFRDQLTTKCLCQLKAIKVEKCHMWNNLFSFSIAKHLSRLQEIEVTDCKNLEEIFTVDRTDSGIIEPVLLNQFHSLTLESLPRLRRICSEAQETSRTQERQARRTTDALSSEIISEDQPDGLPLFGGKVVFPNLKNLKLYKIKLKNIWPNQLPLLSLCIQSLTRLIVKDCSKILYVFSSSTIGSFKQLQQLEIYGCKDLEELIRIDDKCSSCVEFSSLVKLDIWSCPELREFIFCNKVSFPRLQEIRIAYMENLKMIWQNQLIESVQYSPKICKVSLQSCPILENVFPAAIAMSSMQLEEVDVQHCGIKEIVSKEERVNEVALRFVFPKVTSLHLNDLKELRCFYPGKHITEWPKLKELKVKKCEKINLFNLQENDEGRLDVQLQQPDDLFVIDKVFAMLEKVILDADFVRMIWQSPYLEKLFPKLHSLQVGDDSSLVLPLGMLERFRRLEELRLIDSSYTELFSFEEVEKHSRILGQIKSLYLFSLSNLKQMWKQDSIMGLILQKLEILQVDRCSHLIYLMPPLASFENLRILKVMNCKTLIRLVTSSTAKSLVQLEEMKISYCKKLTEIVANEEGIGTEVEIVFQKLKSLELDGLKSLTSFCYENVSFSFPSLEKLILNGCPTMKFFSSGVLCTPILQELSQDWKMYNCIHIDLNTLIKQNHEKKVFSVKDKPYLYEDDIKLILQNFPERQVFSNVRKVYLNGNDIEMIQCSQSPKHVFPKLEVLGISWDESVILPLGIFQTFHIMDKLELWYCSYEEIFSYEEVEKPTVLARIKHLYLSELHDLQQIWRPNSATSLILQNIEILEVEGCKSLIGVLLPSSSFGNLKILKVKNCGRLKSLATASIAKSLVQLEEMEIHGCNMMTEVVASEKDAKVKITFEKLRRLKLNHLSSLTSFSSGNYIFDFPSLEDLMVEECPKMKIFSSGGLSIPILREILQDQTKYIYESDLNKIVQQHHEEMVFSRRELSLENIITILQKSPEDQKVFSKLEQLSFSREEIRMNWQSQLPQHLFPKLKLLEVSDDESKIFPLAILQRFNNVEKLELNYGSYLEMFSCEDVEKHVERLAKLKSLSLYRLDDLKQMWKQNYNMDLILQNLEILEVQWCGGLVTLMPPSASFQNLTILRVEGCDGLTSLLAPSSAKILVRLKELRVRKCNNMIEVISSNYDGAVTEEKIIFNKLRSLNLDGLSSLTSFCSGNYTFDFPCLSFLTLKKSPKIKCFSSGVVNSPALREIKLGYDEEEIIDDDLNTTIQRIHEKLNAKSSTKDIAGGPSVLSQFSASSSAN